MMYDIQSLRLTFSPNVSGADLGQRWESIAHAIDLPLAQDLAMLVAEQSGERTLVLDDHGNLMLVIQP